jgi:hypothetical protein
MFAAQEAHRSHLEPLYSLPAQSIVDRLAGILKQWVRQGQQQRRPSGLGAVQLRASLADVFVWAVAYAGGGGS